MLARNQTNPSRKMAPVLERPGIGESDEQGGRRQNPDAGNLHQGLDYWMGCKVAYNPGILLLDPLFEIQELRSQLSKDLPCSLDEDTGKDQSKGGGYLLKCQQEMDS